MMSANETMAVYSTLGGDPDLGELVEMFVEEMPERIAALEQAFSAGDMKVVQRTAHQMKGSCGSYGFDELTPLAAALELSLRDNEPEADVANALQELIAICRQVRAGGPR